MGKKTFAFGLILALLAALFTALPAVAEGPRLPDIGPLLGVEGELYQTKEEPSGLYDYYKYNTQMTLDQFTSLVVDYGEALRELGFSIQRLSTEGSRLIFLMAYTCETGDATLGVFPTDSGKSLAEGGEGDLAFVLAVPDSMEFTLGEGTSLLAERGTRCIECNGSGSCRYCAGSGSCNYGNGYETCVVCDGSGICNVCDGEGKY